MELDYTGAKNLEEARAIHKAFWDNIHQERADGKWIHISREEFFKQNTILWARMLKKKEEEERKEQEQKDHNDQNTSGENKPVAD